MIILCGTCNKSTEVDFNTHQMIQFWLSHGHFPSKASYICAAGHVQPTGPDAWKDPVEGARLDTLWVEQHQHCVAGSEN